MGNPDVQLLIKRVNKQVKFYEKKILTRSETMGQIHSIIDDAPADSISTLMKHIPEMFYPDILEWISLLESGIPLFNISSCSGVSEVHIPEEKLKAFIEWRDAYEGSI